MPVRVFSQLSLSALGDRSKVLLICSCLKWLSGCGGSTGTGPTTSAQQLSIDTSDHAIATLLYDDVRVPDGFYQEPTSTDVFTSTSHIRNTDLIPVASRHVVMAYDLSTDDFADVVNWSEQAASMQVVAGNLVDSTETSLYHQVSRVDSASPQFVQRHRVYKSSVFNRDGIDEHYRGRINLPAITADDVKAIIEYQWMFTMYNNYGNAVISSTTNETADGFEHVMLQARLQLATSGCDRVEVYRVTYEVDEADGNIWRSSTLEREFDAELDGSQVKVCS